MEDNQIQAADDWAHDHMQNKRASRRSNRTAFTVTDLVLAFEAGVSWERQRGLIEIRRRIRAIEADTRNTA